MGQKRDTFSSKLGFIFAAAGSAVGLGNLWRFPYLAAKYGGGIFILVYLLLAVSFGFTLMITEVSLDVKPDSAQPVPSRNWITASASSVLWHVSFRLSSHHITVSSADGSSNIWFLFSVVM